MKKRLISAFIIFYSLAANGEELSKLSLIENSHDQYPKYSVVEIDGSVLLMPVFRSSTNVSSGIHTIELVVSPSALESGGYITIQCSTESGEVYRVSQYGCTHIGHRMDFDGAKEYWAKIDEESRIKNEAAAAQIKSAAVKNENDQYVADKVALDNAHSKFDIEKVIASVEKKLSKGINREDPDNLLEKAQKKLEPYLKAEEEARVKIAAENAKEAARLVTEENARQARERQEIVAFRKTIASGAETNCGPVIEVKGKLIKVSFAVANYGNEHWIRRDQIFPAEYGCRFYNGEYQSPQ